MLLGFSILLSLAPRQFPLWSPSARDLITTPSSYSHLAIAPVLVQAILAGALNFGCRAFPGAVLLPSPLLGSPLLLALVPRRRLSPADEC